MSLNIKSPSAVEAVRELAALTGESMTSAVERAAREQLKRDKAERALKPSERLADTIREMQEIFARDPRTREEIDDELYDEWGAPR